MSDLISRQDAVSEIDEWIQMATGNGTDMAIKDFLSFLKERIESLPSAEPKTGKWVDCRRGCNYYANCSNCGMQIDVKEKGGYPNFCENCGADMRGEEE